MSNPLLWPALAVLCLIAIGAQWWWMGRLHNRNLAAMRARHQEAQNSAASMLRAARQQNERIQNELAEMRKIIKPEAAQAAKTPPAATDAQKRDQLNQLLDAAPARPVDGFADTLPSRQFTDNSTFGLLHRASTFAAPGKR